MTETPVCVGNIGVGERRKRAMVGWASFLVAVGAYGVLVWLGVGRVWRLVVFLPLWFALLAWLEARGAT